MPSSSVTSSSSSYFAAFVFWSLLLAEGGVALQNPTKGPVYQNRVKAVQQPKKSLQSIPYFAELVDERSAIPTDFFALARSSSSSSSLVNRIEIPPTKYFGDLMENSRLSSFDYGSFAKERPFWNNMMIATIKTGFADFIAQTVIGGTPLDSVDWERSLLFCLFGGIYLGAFQYLYQVNIFRRMFDVDKFTSQSWSEKVRDIPGLKALAAQTAVDLGVSMSIYFPVFYTFKASVFSGSIDPSVWTDVGLSTYVSNFMADEKSCVMCWLPANLICFSVPLYLRLPTRHAVSFLWTAYFSFLRGA